MATNGFLAALLVLQSLGGIEGNVYRAGTDVPVVQVQVSLTNAAPPFSGFTTSTDEAGKFEFKNIPAGDYRLTVRQDADRPSMIQRRLRQGVGRPVTVSAGQQVKNVRMTYTPSGGISGHLRDRLGEPLANLEIEAVRYIYANGSRELSVAGTSKTNAGGEFGITSLPPGRYTVRAMSRPSRNAAPQSIVRLYFPGTVDPASATPIDVLPGSTSDGVDWTMTDVWSARLVGKVINGLTGQLIKISTTSIMLRGTTSSETLASVSAPDGRFEFRSIVPGSYELAVSAAGSEETQGVRVAGRLQFEVVDKDIEELALVLQPGARVPGRIVFSDGTLPQGTSPFGDLRVELRTIPWQPQLSSNFPYGPTRPATDGTFSLPGVLSGKYQVSITGVPADRYVKSATFGAADALDATLQFDPAAANSLEIVLGSAPASFEATVFDRRKMPGFGATVVLVPDVPHRQRLDLYRSAIADGTGQARISSLVPGEYKVFAFENIEVGAWFDPDFFRTYEDRGRRVRIAEGGRETAELTVIDPN